MQHRGANAKIPKTGLEKRNLTETSVQANLDTKCNTVVLMLIAQNSTMKVTWQWLEKHHVQVELKIDAFELSCWRRLLRVLWRAKTRNKEIRKKFPNPEWFSTQSQNVSTEVAFLWELHADGQQHREGPNGRHSQRLKKKRSPVEMLDGLHTGGRRYQPCGCCDLVQKL